MKPKRWDELLADSWDLAAAMAVEKGQPEVAIAYRYCAAELRQQGYRGEAVTAYMALRHMRNDCFNLADSWRTRAAGLPKEAAEEVRFCARELESEADGAPGRRPERHAKGR